MDLECKHCNILCGFIVARGLCRRCYDMLRYQGRLDEYSKISRTGEYPKMSRAGIANKRAKHNIIPEIPASAIEAIHFDEAYFFCERQRCTLRKAACVRRQTKPPQGGAGIQIRLECENRIQGRKILKELKAAEKASCPGMIDRSMIHERRHNEQQ